MCLWVEEKSKGEDNASVAGCFLSKKRKASSLEQTEQMTMMMQGPSAFKNWQPSSSETVIIEAEPPSDSQKQEKDGLLPFKKRKISPVNNAGGSSENTQLAGISNSSASSNCYQTGEKKGGCFSNRNHPYMKSPSSRKAERGWLEMGFRLGVTRPELCLSKRVTQTDTKHEQNRFQLTVIDIAKASPFLQELAQQARGTRPPNGVAVKVMDRMGCEYDMTFKFVVSSRTYRFMGGDYRKFLVQTGLRENQIVDIWGLPQGRRGRSSRETWFAFVSSDERIESFEGEDGEGREQIAEQLQALESWNVVL